MAAVLWAPTFESVNILLPSTSGTDNAIGTKIRDRLSYVGATYDSAFTTEVSSLKDRTLAEAEGAVAAHDEAAELAFDQAYRACLYVESLLPPPDPPRPELTFEPTSRAGITARLDSAIALTSDADLKWILGEHKDAIARAYNSRPSPRAAKASFFDISHYRRTKDGLVPVYIEIQNIYADYPSVTFTREDGRAELVTVRYVEDELIKLIDRANGWIATVQYEP